MKTEVVFNYDELASILPQSAPFIFIDRVTEFKHKEKVVATKNVTGGEWFFQGHFPRKAVFPGVLLQEGIAQTAIVLFYDRDAKEQSTDDAWLLVGIKSRFISQVTPGDQVEYTVKPGKLISSGGIIEGSATVNGETVMRSTLTVTRIEK